MKTTSNDPKQIEQFRVDSKAYEELLRRRLEIKNTEKERMRREVEERLSAKIDAIAQEWVEYDLHQVKLGLIKNEKERLG